MARTPPLVIPNCVQIRILGNVGSNGCINVLHARKLPTLAVDQTLANSVGTAIKNAWTTNIGPLSNGNAALVRVGVRDLSNANQPEFLDTGATAVGTGTGDLMPAQVASVVTLKTALSGKSFRGRVYVWGFIETQNAAGGDAAGTVATGAVNYITAIKNGLSPLSLFLCVASRPSFGSVTTKLTTFNDGTTESEVVGRENARSGGTSDVTLIQSRNAAWETQRSRNNGRGALASLTRSVVFEQAV